MFLCSSARLKSCRSTADKNEKVGSENFSGLHKPWRGTAFELRAGGAHLSGRGHPGVGTGLCRAEVPGERGGG